MVESINEIAVIGCALLMTALYVLWSELFGAKEEHTRTEAVELLFVGLGFLVLTFICALAISRLDEIGLSPLAFSGITALFAAAALVPSYLRSGKGIRTYALDAAFISSVCVADILTLTYWPW